MNLSNDGTLKTTNIVLQNLNRLQNTRYISLSEGANETNKELITIYAQQMGLLASVNEVYNKCREI